MRISGGLLSLAALVSAFTVADISAAQALPEAPTAAAPAKQTKEQFATSIAHTVLSVIKDTHMPFAQKQATLKQKFTQVVDIDWIARFVLGKSWNAATPEQRKEYTALYRVYLTETYVANFDEESAQKIKDIKILGIKDVDDESFMARTEVMLTDSEDARVEYLVADHKGEYKIIDIVIEGVSMLATHRSEFTELAASKGLNGLIGQLQQMVDHAKMKVAALPAAAS